MTTYVAVLKRLQVDRVVTDALLSRAGLHGAQFPGLILTVRPLSGSLKETEVHFRTHDAQTLLNKPSDLPHYAGLAAMRAQVQQPADHWSVLVTGSATRPDAVLKRDNAVIAVEFDAGYRYRVVKQKMRAFEDYDAVIWGTTSALRAARLRAMYPAVQVLTVDYWTATQT
ncbi:hypothetical protein [Deinococcus ruber]|uniref:Uncharacterized protein n=1 Tax=Deinococcus ruber TaxID=1848197 RepID=A0A918C962_9DEIO|nr:hypothetical protein [Deinococcus ruber]GGR12845.1 hypothetical protein GCM10008957_27240 [Deinococcus ruber]